MHLSEEEYANIVGKKPIPQKKKSKYNNVKVYVCKNGMVFEDRNLAKQYGIDMTFDSKKEYNRWLELQLLEKAHEISNLQRQVKWVISNACLYHDEKIREIAYKADFQYIRDGSTVVEDVKPFDTRKLKYRTTKDFNLKWKLLKSKYPDILFELY